MSDEEKALFIPLKTEHYRRFESGEKNWEYRRYGIRWNERTCRVGRPVTLSLGYGKRERISRTVHSFKKQWMNTPEWLDCYGEAGYAACIYLPY